MNMTPEDNTTPSPGAGQPPHRRRKRYGGTHPKQFGEKYKELDPQKYPQMQEHIRARGRTPAGTHVPIMVREVLAALKPAAGEIVADCTLGYGGHAGEFMKRIGGTGLLVGFDLDGKEMERTRYRLQPLGVPMNLHHMNYAGLGKAIAEDGLAGYDIIFADLGVSSMQVDDPSRGISYKHEGPLDMRMDSRMPRTGADLLAALSREELSKALWELSDEPDHDRIAQFIVNQRQAVPIETTSQLTRLVFAAKGTTEKAWKKQAEYHDLHPAARTFQALRILVNDELGSLKALLRQAPHCLKPGGRLGIISFHSGEDRLVKNAFRDGFQDGTWAATSADVIRPSGQEVRDNPRSSSAKFRWAIKPK